METAARAKAVEGTVAGELEAVAVVLAATEAAATEVAKRVPVATVGATAVAVASEALLLEPQVGKREGVD